MDWGGGGLRKTVPVDRCRFVKKIESHTQYSRVPAKSNGETLDYPVKFGDVSIIFKVKNKTNTDNLQTLSFI